MTDEYIPESTFASVPTIFVSRDLRLVKENILDIKIIKKEDEDSFVRYIETLCILICLKI